ncbi:MAG: N-6 DNA methylase [Ignavibacteriales bacterium]|nr:N-6 DNA methylase [Ignavibacteriales bacterium]
MNKTIHIKEKLAESFRRYGVEGEAAFHSIALQYYRKYSKVLQNIPEPIVYKWSRSYSNLETDLNIKTFLNDLVLQDPMGEKLSDLYQFFIGRKFREGSGKFFTPKVVASAMAKMLPSIENPTIMDPTCGGGTFLAEASYLWRQDKCTLVANDIEYSLIELSMLVLGLSTPKKHRKYFSSINIFDPSKEITSWYGQVDFILANPPFSLQIDNEQFDSELFLAGYRNSDALFIDTALKLLKPGGRLISLLPHSVIANKDFSSLRNIVEKRWNPLGIISLPEGVFHLAAGTTTRADIVVLQKRGSPSKNGHKMFFASTPSVGIKLNRNALQPDTNDLETLLDEKEVQKVLNI